MFNSPSSGYVLTAAEMAAIYDAIPAVVAVKEGVQDSIMPTLELHALVPDLLIWECDFMVYEAGWLQDGIVAPAQLGTAGYLFESPDDKWYSRVLAVDLGRRARRGTRVLEGELRALRARARSAAGPRCYPGRPEYFTHWGEAYKLAASVIGLPVGDYPYSRPPQVRLPEEARVSRSAPRTRPAGMAGKARVPAIASS